MQSLRGVRVGVSLVLTLGVAASIVANILHAQPTLVGRAIAAWVSYWHMVEVAHDHGETADSAHLIPLSGRPRGGRLDLPGRDRCPATRADYGPGAAEAATRSG